MSAVAMFPKAKKRGAKVRKGPAAKVLPFPSQLTGDALSARWAWLNHYAESWKHEETEGSFEDERDWESTVRICRGVSIACGKDFSEETMRRDIAQNVALIQKRIQVKDWLETVGVDWDAVRSPEDALFFAYDRLRNSLPLGAA